MSKTIELIRNHKRVESVTVQDGGDTLWVYLVKGWNRYGRCGDGYSKGFYRDNGETATSALNWVRREIHECKDATCPRCRPQTAEDIAFYGGEHAA
ncbi:hypothetical protein LAV_00130 [Sphingobium phage Lacusarx]|uniref:Uncharacterized protein n=1 Tax=Sphingobium phage Lacusarx TaxID=1980139 RepID=A0A1W6DX77_9CAUD|nr:hypothetical protein FDH44_gp173 [Sphingobium phage Lacusarx]ARK07505.1 hypothetical protein LAV_00130 [Sphingobium phage Lacusarx]